MASNHFRKCFSVNAGVWLRMENKFSGSYFQLTMCFSWFDPKIGFSPNFHFKPFPDSHAKREKAQITPQTELQFNNPHSTGLVNRNTAPIAPDRTGLITPRHTSANPHQHRSTLEPIKQRLTPTPIASRQSTPKSDDPHQRQSPIAPRQLSKD